MTTHVDLSEEDARRLERAEAAILASDIWRRPPLGWHESLGTIGRTLATLTARLPMPFKAQDPAGADLSVTVGDVRRALGAIAAVAAVAVAGARHAGTGHLTIDPHDGVDRETRLNALAALRVEAHLWPHEPIASLDEGLGWLETARWALVCTITGVFSCDPHSGGHATTGAFMALARIAWQMLLDLDILSDGSLGAAPLATAVLRRRR